EATGAGLGLSVGDGALPVKPISGHVAHDDQGGPELVAAGHVSQVQAGAAAIPPAASYRGLSFRVVRVAGPARGVYDILPGALLSYISTRIILYDRSYTLALFFGGIQHGQEAKEGHAADALVEQARAGPVLRCDRAGR